MIGITELGIVIGMLGLAGSYIWIVHRLLSSADGPEKPATKSLPVNQTHDTKPALAQAHQVSV